jgi:hypothetical protein
MNQTRGFDRMRSKPLVFAISADQQLAIGEMQVPLQQSSGRPLQALESLASHTQPMSGRDGSVQ